ncbi:MAG: DUF4388 domain-containing protein [Anaerolineae bacterium]|nr:DUF4388 domain-containing protein [Anaerolineae bacterium]
MATTGRLSEMSLPTLVQLACQGGNPCKLSVRRDDQEVVLYFDGFNLVHAMSDELTGEEVVYRALAWEDGEFSLETGVTTPDRSIETPWSVLLMEALHRLDETRWDQLQTVIAEEESDMPENMKEILKELSQQVPGFVTAAVVGMDGLGIADYAVAKLDMEAVDAQMTLLLKLVDTSVNRLKAGAVEDYLLTTDKAYLLVRFLSDRKDYYLGIIADRNTNLGSLRLNSRLYAERLAKAMPY